MRRRASNPLVVKRGTKALGAYPVWFRARAAELRGKGWGTAGIDAELKRVTQRDAAFEAMWNDRGRETAVVAAQFQMSQAEVFAHATALKRRGVSLIDRHHLPCRVGAKPVQPIDPPALLPRPERLAAELRDQGYVVDVDHYRVGRETVVEWRVDGIGRVRLPDMLDLLGRGRGGAK